MSYYTAGDGLRINFKDVAAAVKALHPEVSGKHIFQQLDALDLMDGFMRGHTPVCLPYSFTDYLENTDAQNN